MCVNILFRIADARYGSWDRLYYNSVFSVIVLAPASLYLEEAFEALNFHHDRQGLFLAGCFASAFIGIKSTRMLIWLEIASFAFCSGGHKPAHSPAEAG